MTLTLRAVLAALVMAFAMTGLARADEPLADPDAEARALELMRELGCPVCSGQSIADSDAAVAAEMRRLVRVDVADGLSDAVVLDNMAARYNEGVRLRPAARGAGALLWFMPVIVLAIGVAIAGLVVVKAARADAASSGED